MWFNDVETKPGIGYPRSWEDQSKNKGGWELKRGKLRLKQGGKLSRLIKIFFNPVLPAIEDYYEPWTYDYQNLTSAPQGSHQPVARPVSSITGYNTQPDWGPNWEDDLAGSRETAPKDVKKLHTEILSILQREEEIDLRAPNYIASRFNVRTIKVRKIHIFVHVKYRCGNREDPDRAE